MREWIDEIVENGKPEDMEELSEILIKVMHKLKKYDDKCYNKYRMKIYKMAYGTEFTEELAEEIVLNMKPTGEHWDIDQTTSVKTQYGITEINDTDFYVVMNMAYNDYHDIFMDNIDMYVKFTKDFILDEDAKEDKVFKYFT
jgi:hypothetical protein